MGRKKRSSWHEQVEALKAEAEKLPYGIVLQLHSTSSDRPLRHVRSSAP
jgi:hypothetical protein